MTELECKFFLAKLARRLKTLRLEYNFTQKEVANYLGVHHSVYSRYERGISEPTVNELVAFAKLYKTSTDYLLSHTEDRRSSGLLDGITYCKPKK